MYDGYQSALTLGLMSVEGAIAQRGSLQGPVKTPIVSFFSQIIYLIHTNKAAKPTGPER